MQRNVFSFLSAIFFIFTYLPYSRKFGDFFFDISPNTPAIFGVLGLVFAILGIKGKVRMTLILLNSLSLFVFIFVLLIAVYGFQEP